MYTKLICKIQEHSLYLQNTLYFIYTIILVIFFVYTLNKGMFWGDEAWHQLHLLDNIESASVSQWYKVFGFLNFNDIVLNRHLIFFLNITSSIIFVFGCGQFIGNKKKIDLILIGVLTAIIFKLPLQVSPCWDYYNIILTNIIGGLTFFSLSSTKKSYQNTIWTFIGFLLLTIPFIKITSSPLIFIVTGIIYYKHKNDKSNYRSIFYITLGAITFVTILFAIHPFSYFINQLKVSSLFIKYDTNHGVGEIIKWCISTIKYFFFEIFPLSILLWISFKYYKKYLYLYWITAAVIFAQFAFNILEAPSSFFPIKVIYIIAGALIIDRLYLKDFKTSIIIAFAMSIPILLTIGTDHSFASIASVFSSPLIAVVLIIQKNKRYFHFNFLTHQVFVTVIFILFYYNFNKNNLAGYNFAEQTVIANNSCGKYLYIDLKKYQKLRELENIIPQGNHVIVSNPNLWGYVYLQNLKPLILFFRYNQEAINEYLSIKKNTINSFYLISEKGEFSNEMRYEIDSFDIKRIETEHFIVYYYY
ncbi:hypothetical protein [Carboxylicivirga sp. RSCT41]|uniref:hypothetical protein n=1 Tax=Carboxylicivirga agarovorans TaxID=3417570 RepID=UPI003D3391FD